MKEWHEGEMFWEVMYPKLFSPMRWEMATQEVEHIITLLDLHPDLSVLDLCCGPGRHSLEFARRQYAVTGVDRTERYIAAARHRAESAQLQIEFIKDDMRTFYRSGAFDVVLNLFTSFGYFSDPAADQVVLKNIHTSLKPEGLVIFEMIGKEILARIYQPRDWFEDQGKLFLEERKPSPDWCRMDNRWIVVDESGRQEVEFSHRIFSGGEMKLLLLQAGFLSVQIYGNLAGEPYNHQATRLVVVARK
ncbi:class I SAM-dependent methyltransferase [candidate division CSSED10-310 bacterium]|uniref:Class I SAM-dependent methyltransferase n=1 Tax=candidate division CSSED10-310 bacterium TaxID=2855610 RepID=A0ABV6YWE5_UNCC1